MVDLTNESVFIKGYWYINIQAILFEPEKL